MATPPRLWTRPREQGGQPVKEDEDLNPVPSGATGVYGTQPTTASAEFNSYQGTVNPNAQFLGGEPGFSANEFGRMQAIGADAGRNLGNLAVQQATAGGAAAGAISDAAMGARNEAAAIGDRISQNAALRAADIRNTGGQIGQNVTGYTQAAGQNLAGTGANIGQTLTQTGQRVGGDLAGTGAEIQGGLSRTGQQLEAGIRDATTAEAAALRAAGTRYGQGVSGGASAGADRLVNTGAAQGAGITGYGQQAATNIAGIGAAAAQDIRGVGREGQTALTGMGRSSVARGMGTERGALATTGRLTTLEDTEGPSAAQAVLRSGLSKAQADALSTARSGSGWGDSSSALRAGLRAQSTMGTEAMNEAARLRAAENAAWRARQAQNLGTAAGLQSEIGLAQSTRGLQATQAGYGLGMQGAQGAGQLGTSAAAQAGQLGLQGTTAGGELTTQARQQAEALRQAGAQAGANLGMAGTSQAANLNANAAMGAGNLRAGLESAGAGIGANTATAGAGITSAAATNAANIGAQTATSGTQIGAAGTTAGAGLEQNALFQGAEMGQAGDIAGGQFTMGGEQMGIGGLTSAAGVEQGALANAAGTRQAETAAVLGAENAGMDVLKQQAALQMAYNEEMRKRYEGLRGLELKGEEVDQGWLSGIMGGTAAGAGALSALFSDVRLKQDIRSADRELIEAAKSPEYWNERVKRDQEQTDLLRAAQTREYWENRAAAEDPRQPMPEDYGYGVWTSGPKKGEVVYGRPTPRELPPTVEQAAEASGLPYGVWRSGPKKGQVEYGEVTPRVPPQEPLDPATEAAKLRAAADAVEKESWLERARRKLNEFGEQVGEDALRGMRRTGQSIKNLFSGDEQAALETTRAAPPYSWNYTDPAMGRGRFYGPMAQDLEMTPAGRSAVIETPQGKAIDGGRLAALSFATNSAQQREIDSLREEVARLKAAS